jgi:hypothetical protein
MKKTSAPSLRQGTRGARAPKAYSPLHGCTLPPTMKLNPRGFGVTAQELGGKTSPWLEVWHCRRPAVKLSHRWVLKWNRDDLLYRLYHMPMDLTGLGAPARLAIIFFPPAMAAWTWFISVSLQFDAEGIRKSLSKLLCLGKLFYRKPPNKSPLHAISFMCNLIN